MTKNDELKRAEFEHWADSQGFDLHIFEGEYDDPATANAWKKWQAEWHSRSNQEDA